MTMTHSRRSLGRTKSRPPRIRPRALAGVGSAFLAGARALKADVCLIAIVHNRNDVAPALRGSAGRISARRDHITLRFQPGHLHRRGPGTRDLRNHQHVTCPVARFDCVRGVRLAASAGGGNLILGQRQSGAGSEQKAQNECFMLHAVSPQEKILLYAWYKNKKPRAPGLGGGGAFETEAPTTASRAPAWCWRGPSSRSLRSSRSSGSLHHA